MPGNVLLLHIRKALDTLSASRRQLASVAGFIMSIAPAVYMAPVHVYTRCLFQPMSSNTHWETTPHVSAANQQGRLIVTEAKLRAAVLCHMPV